MTTRKRKDTKTPIEEAISKAIKDLEGVPENLKGPAFTAILSHYLGQSSQEQSILPSTGRAPRTGAVTKPGNKKKRSRPDEIRDMIASGYFKKERTISEIATALRERALPTARTAMPALILPFVLSKELKRKLVPGKGKQQRFVYFT